MAGMLIAMINPAAMQRFSAVLMLPSCDDALPLVSA
jgi:hypothetical protein